MRTKTVYIGNNVGAHNWGCRATSLALRQIALADHDIIYSQGIQNIMPNAHKPYPVNPKILPRKVVRKLFGRIDRSGIVKKYFEFEGSMGMKLSLLTDDPDVSLQNVLQHGEQHPYYKHLLKAVKECDQVVINGEGTLILATPTRTDLQYYLLVIKLAKHFKKPAYFVNGMASESPTSAMNEKVLRYCVETLSYCKEVNFRDPVSLKFMQQKGLKKGVYIPDALFSWTRYFDREVTLPSQLDFLIPFPEDADLFTGFSLEEDYICLAGSSSAARDQDKAYKHYEALYEELKTLGLPILIVIAAPGDKFLYQLAINKSIPVLTVEVPILMGAAVLSKAKAFVSGRYHPSILASLSGTPCVFLGSNSHKTLSLQYILEYDDPIEYSALPTAEDNAAIKDHVIRILADTELRDKIKKNAEKASLLTKELKSLINH